MRKIKLITDDDIYEGEGDTVLATLEDARVFSVEKTEDGLFRVEEHCDKYFHADLTKEQLIEVAAELVRLADT